MTQLEVIAAEAPPTGDSRLRAREFIVAEGDFKVTNDLKAGLEARTNDFFRDQQRVLVANYQSSPLWEHFQYMVVMDNKANPFSLQDRNYDAILGILTAFKLRTEHGTEFILYDTIGIDIHHRGQGYLSELVKSARKIDQNIPAALRTKIPDSHRRYERLSDDNLPITGSYNGQNIQYNVHFFGITQQNPQAGIVGQQIANLKPKFQPSVRYT